MATTTPTKRGQFGEALAEIRNRRGISQAALAKRAQVSAGYVGLIETGQRGDAVSLDIVRRFVQALDANMEETETLLRASGHLNRRQRLIPDGRPSFSTFVSDDPLLAPSQKDILIRLYRSWIAA